jgi:hypothetical protein
LLGCGLACKAMCVQPLTMHFSGRPTMIGERGFVNASPCHCRAARIPILNHQCPSCTQPEVFHFKSL